MVLGPSGGITLPNWPMPRLMSNHGNFIGSLGATTRWLAARAEALGVEIYPGFAATEMLFGAEWRGGRHRHRRHGHRPRRQAEGQLHPRHGAARQICAARRGRARLADQADRRPLSSRRGPRSAEIRHRPQGNLAGRSGQIPARPRPAQFRLAAWARAPAAARSSIITTKAWSPSASSSISITPIRPCRRSTNSSASRPIRLIVDTFSGGKRLAYGARAISSGGWQSAPKLSFPGGALIGCAAGFVNFARIKGSHNAILSGMLAAEKLHEALAAGRANDELTAYEEAWRALRHRPRSLQSAQRQAACGRSSAWRSASRSAVSTCGPTNSLGFSLFGTLKHGKPDSATLKPLAEVDADRLSQARRAYLLRQALLGLPVQHQSRRGSAGPSAPEGPDHSDPRQSARIWRAGAALLPGRRL